MFKTRFPASLACVIGIVATTATATAEPIVFTHASSAVGVLDGNLLNGGAAVNFIITSMADTDSVVPIDANAHGVANLHAMISIEGVGDFDFLTPTRTFARTYEDGVGIVGFARESPSRDLVNGPQILELANWALDSDIGPLSGPGRVLQWDHRPVLTTGGVLEFFDSEDILVTFSARVIPAPSGGMLLLVSSGALARRRR